MISVKTSLGEPWPQAFSARCAAAPVRISIDQQGIAPMPKRSMKQDDPLEDFTRRDITLDGVTKAAYVAGAGPAALAMTGMPGISPHVARLPRCVLHAR